MRIEKASGSDIEALVRLRLEYLREDLGPLADRDRETISERLPAYFRAHLGRDLICYLLREGGEAVSCAFLLLAEKPMSPAFINGRTGTVLNVYTRPSHRHRGFAGALIRELLADAERMELCTVELKSTDAGVSVYRSAGFADDDSGYRRMKWTNGKMQP